MAIDRAEFAIKCVREELNCGINPHYLLGMAHRAFDAFALANNHDPSALELYLQQWPAAPKATLSADLQAALDATAALVDPAVVPNASPSMPPKIDHPDQSALRAVVGPLIKKLEHANLQRWQNMHVNSTLFPQLDGVARRLIAPFAKMRYRTISTTTQVPWFIIALIHKREASHSFNANIAQGDPWNKVSIHVPAGRGPFDSFEAAAIDALTNCAPFAAHWKDWTIGGALTLLEQYNGFGYARRGLPSPYIWASTDQYVRGKFVADRHFDPNAIDHQLGCAALLARMKIADETIMI